MFFPAVDKAWKCKVLEVVRRNGAPAGSLTQSVDLPQLQVDKLD